jgi:hypothetical protein
MKTGKPFKCKRWISLIFLILLFTGVATPQTITTPGLPSTGNSIKSARPLIPIINTLLLCDECQGSITVPGFESDLPVPFGVSFCHTRYLTANLDVAASPYYGIRPYQHYVEHGETEGRDTCPCIEGWPTPGFPDDLPVPCETTFCHYQYLEAYPDVAKDGYYGKRPYQHYVDFGKMEGRRACPCDEGAIVPGFELDLPVPCGVSFCHTQYLTAYPDVAGDAYYSVRPYLHFVKFGKAEGRYACPITDYWPLPNFQLGISFYNGHHAPDYVSQLIRIRQAGFDNIRVFVNRFNPNNAGFTVFNESGNLTSEINGVLATIGHAKNLGMTTNITFWARYEGSLRSDKRSSIDNYLKGILNTTRAIVNYGYTEHDFYLDLGNEHNDPVAVGGHISESDLQKIIAAVKSEFPKIKLTASITGWMSTRDASAYAARNNLDILSYHEHRGAGVWRWNDMDGVVAELKSIYPGPVFLDEPACSDYIYTSGFDNPGVLETVTTDRLKTAYQATKSGGARMWLLHHHACWPPDFPNLNHDGVIPSDMQNAERGFFNASK